MWCTKFEAALFVAIAGVAAACSDQDTATFPPGTGYPDGETSEAGITPAPDAATDDADVAPWQQPRDASKEPSLPADAAHVPWDAASEPDQGFVEPPAPPQDAMPDVLEAGPEASPLDPSVMFVSPQDGAEVSNPVTFEIVARNVAYVSLFADDYALCELWSAGVYDTFEYTFLGVNYPREIRLVGMDAYEQPVAEDSITITVVE
ncbi:MAG: hypothetical protein ACOC1F_09045 [Myxococcota bacterium]